jgi:hypothetical protein
MNQRPLAATLSLVMLAVPGVAQAQDDRSPVPRDLVERLCSAELAGEADVASCLAAVGAVLSEALPPDLVGALDIDLQATLDEAIGGLQDIGVGAALDDAVTRLQGVDLEAAVNDAIAAAQDLDVRAAIAEALAAGETDLQAALEAVLSRADEAISGAREADVDAFLVDGMTTARAVVAEAEAWVTENAELVCAGSSVGAGVGAAAVVAYLTGSPGLAISAFDRTEQFSRDVCDDVASPGPSPAASQGAG